MAGLGASTASLSQDRNSCKPPALSSINVKLKEFIIAKPLLYEMLKGLTKKKKMVKTMNSKMTTNSQLSTTKPKTKNKTNQSRGTASMQ